MTAASARCAVPRCPALGTYLRKADGARICPNHAGYLMANYRRGATHDPGGLDPAAIRAFLDEPDETGGGR